MASTPIKIDPAIGEWAQEYSNFQQGPFLVGSALYAMLSTATTLEVFKSVDAGITWTLQDAANEPTDANLNGGACCFDGVHTLWVAYCGAGENVLVATFDTSTDTWTTGLGSSVDTPLQVYACVLRTDGTMFISTKTFSVTSTLGYLIFDTLALAFTTSGDLGANILSLPEYSISVQGTQPVFGAAATPADIIYFGFLTLDISEAPQMQAGMFFASFTLANAIENFFVVPGQIGNPQPDPPAFEVDNGPFMMGPAVCGGAGPNLVFGVTPVSTAGGNVPSIYVSTDGGVSWTLDTAPSGIDPGITPGAQDAAQFVPFPFFDGSKLYCVYSQLRNFIFPSPSIRLAITTPDFGSSPDTWTWAAQTALDYTQVPGMVANTDGFSFPKFKVFGGDAYFSTDIFFPPNLEAFFVPFSFGPPPPTTGGRFFGSFIGFGVAGQMFGGTK
jgi:hypothetical protein